MQLMTTLCYIENDNNEYLMLHRVKKENDMNKDKYLGVGGKFEENESPFDCIRREIKEETGLNAENLSYRGIVTFISDIYPCGYMHLFICDKYSGEIKKCDEGNLVWIKKEDIYNLPLWEGDKIFFKLLEEKRPFFSLKLTYKGDKLEKYIIE